MLDSLHKQRAPGSQNTAGRDQQPTGLLGPGVEIEGRASISGGTFYVDAQFKGEISSTSVVVVGEHGEVEAQVAAKVVTIMGKVKGTIRALELLEIKEHGVVLGDISTPVLVVEAGGYFDGACHMPSPEAAKPIAAAAANQDLRK
jgi:cytoskeletal protein CcmA (bactofilin family)